jgi:hypothetical protein
MVLKLDSDGQVVWISTLASDGSGSCSDITLDRGGNPVVLGSLSGNVEIGSTPIRSEVAVEDRWQGDVVLQQLPLGQLIDLGGGPVAAKAVIARYASGTGAYLSGFGSDQDWLSVARHASGDLIVVCAVSSCG